MTCKDFDKCPKPDCHLELCDVPDCFKQPDNPQTEQAEASSLSDLLNALQEIKAALYATGEFNGYECGYGHKLGTCQNDDCIHCRVKRALDTAGI